MWYPAAQDLTFKIDYEVDGEFVVPTSATYVVWSAAGTLLTSGSLPVTTTSAMLTVLAVHNGLTPPNLFENRFVEVFFQYGGQHHKFLSYNLRSFVPITATPAAVRAELGVDFSELPDADIDVFAAYFRLIEANNELFAEAFTVSGVKNLAANKAVVIQAALDVALSLDLRVAGSTRTEDQQFERMAGVDFDRIVRRLRLQLSTLLDQAVGATPAAPVIFALSNPTDVVTGT